MSPITSCSPGTKKVFPDVVCAEPMSCCAVSNSVGAESCVMSPVWSRKAGRVGSALMRSIDSRSVAVTSWFAALLKPMWLSLIWTKNRSPFATSVPMSRPRPSAVEVGMPPVIAQSMPVPAQAMHLRKPRRSTPSSL